MLIQGGLCGFPVPKLEPKQREAMKNTTKFLTLSKTLMACPQGGMSAKILWPKLAVFSLMFGHILNVLSAMADWFAVIPFALCKASPGTRLEYPQLVL